MHDVSPALAVNVPWVQLEHVRSLVAVATAVIYVPAMQGMLTLVHGAASSTLEKDTPTWHAVQVRSAVADPAASKPVPAEHVRHAAHAWFPADTLNIPSGQTEHTRSLAAVGLLLMYSPAAHGVPTV
jgi:hypothetical protein